MTLQEIKDAHADGKTVCWSNVGYQVRGKDPDNLSIVCIGNNHCIGLTHQDGITMNGKPEEFFIQQPPATNHSDHE